MWGFYLRYGRNTAKRDAKRVTASHGADQVSPKGAIDTVRGLITAADRCSHPGPGRYCRRMSEEPGREQNWYPISKLGWFTGHIRDGIEVTRCQLEMLQPARARPYVLDDATVAGIIRVHRDQAADLTLFQNQADRWKAGPGLTGAQRAGIAAYETLIAELRQVNSEVLAVAAELSHGTIETVLAKSDLQLGMEALLRRPPG